MSSLRSFIGSRPALFFPLYRLTRRTDRARALLFNEQTELVLEGFPRSGNTFAVLAFRQAQARPVAIAHHLHHAAQVLRGVRKGVPTVVLIRQPAAAVRSLALRRPGVPMRTLIGRYVDFYAAVESVRDGCYVVDFETVTRDFGAVTRAINQRFDTNFGCFDHTPENVARVFAEIDRINAALGGSENDVSRPSAARQALAKHEFSGAEARLLARANDLYRSLGAAG